MCLEPPFLILCLKFRKEKNVSLSKFVQHINSSSAVKTYPCVLLLASRQFNEYTIVVIGKRGSGSTRQKRKYAGKVLREVDIEHIQKTRCVIILLVTLTVSRVSQGNKTMERP